MANSTPFLRFPGVADDRIATASPFVTPVGDFTIELDVAPVVWGNSVSRGWYMGNDVFFLNDSTTAGDLQWGFINSLATLRFGNLTPGVANGVRATIEVRFLLGVGSVELWVDGVLTDSGAITGGGGQTVEVSDNELSCGVRTSQITPDRAWAGDWWYGEVRDTAVLARMDARDAARAVAL